MAQNPNHANLSIPAWQRNLLVAAAIFSVLLIAMGGILCVTQSIRDCPDWPGCFGRIYPPLEAGPLLEYTHRVLAALTGLLILSTAITGFIRKLQSPWITIPPLVSVALLVLVSYFGAVVVLRGLAPVWAAVDVGSALLVVALMVTSAVVANESNSHPGAHLDFSSTFSRLVLATTVVVYMVLVSGVLVAGKNPLVGCLGWPIYSPIQFEAGSLSLGGALRIILSIVGIGLIVTMMVHSWHRRKERLHIYHFTRWVGLVFLLEALIQILLLVFGLPVFLLGIYTVIAAVFWALLVTLLVRSGQVSSVT